MTRTVQYLHQYMQIHPSGSAGIFQYENYTTLSLSTQTVKNLDISS